MENLNLDEFDQVIQASRRLAVLCQGCSDVTYGSYGIHCRAATAATACHSTFLSPIRSRVYSPYFIHPSFRSTCVRWR